MRAPLRVPRHPHAGGQREAGRLHRGRARPREPARHGARVLGGEGRARDRRPARRPLRDARDHGDAPCFRSSRARSGGDGAPPARPADRRRWGSPPSRSSSSPSTRGGRSTPSRSSRRRERSSSTSRSAATPEEAAAILGGDGEGLPGGARRPRLRRGRRGPRGRGRPAAAGAAGRTLALAESCTGGMVSSLVTDVPGSSDYFLGGVVSYAQRREGGASSASREETLRAHGAVSEETAREMARGAVESASAPTSPPSVTGIAGPDGGSDEKPVGTVWFAIADRDGREVAKKRAFVGDRGDVRRSASVHALELVRRHLVGWRVAGCVTRTPSARSSRCRRTPSWGESARGLVDGAAARVAAGLVDEAVGVAPDAEVPRQSDAAKTLAAFARGDRPGAAIASPRASCCVRRERAVFPGARARARARRSGFAPAPRARVRRAARGRRRDRAARGSASSARTAPFRPHVTLARLRDPLAGARRSSGSGEAAASWPFPAWRRAAASSTRAGSDPAGAVHTALAEWSLAGAPTRGGACA